MTGKTGDIGFEMHEPSLCIGPDKSVRECGLAFESASSDDPFGKNIDPFENVYVCGDKLCDPWFDPYNLPAECYGWECPDLHSPFEELPNPNGLVEQCSPIYSEGGGFFDPC